MGGQTSGVSTQELFAPTGFSCRFVLFVLLVPFVSLAVTGADKLSTDWGTDGTEGEQTSGVSTQGLFAPTGFSYRFVLFALLVPFVSPAVAGADKLSTDWGTD